MGQGCASFYLNGVVLGDAMEGVDVSHRWFPAASLTGGQQLQFFFTGPAPGSSWQPDWQPLASGKLHSRDAEDFRVDAPAGLLARAAPLLPGLQATALSALPSLKEAELALYAEASLATLGPAGGWLGLVLPASGGGSGIGVAWGYSRPEGVACGDDDLLFGSLPIHTAAEGRNDSTVLGVGLTTTGVAFATVNGDMQGTVVVVVGGLPSSGRLGSCLAFFPLWVHVRSFSPAPFLLVSTQRPCALTSAWDTASCAWPAALSRT